jgi:NitT/TauT family transport system substrate-binding protein
MLKKQMICCVLFSMLAAALFGSGGVFPADAASISDGKPLPPIKVGIINDSATRPALVVAADALGYYKEEGVDVQFINLDGGGTAWTSIEAGNLDVFPYSVCGPLSLIAQNGNFIIFAGTATEGSSLIVGAGRENIDFSDYKNWAGKKIGVEALAESETLPLIREDLKAQGVLDQVEFIIIEDAQARLEALRKGALDAAVIVEERAAVARELGLVEAFTIGDKYPSYVCCRQTTSFKSLEEKRESYVKYLKAQIRAYRDYKIDTEKVVLAVSKFVRREPEYVRGYIATENPKSVTESFVHFKNQVNPDPSFNNVEQLYKALIASGVLEEDKNASLAAHVNVSIFKEALDELIAEYPDDETYKEILYFYNKNNSNFS